MAINIYEKNETRDKLKQFLERKNSENEQQKVQEYAAAVRRSEGARPLLSAYSNLADQCLRVEVLRAVWPLDFDKRDDTFKNLLLGYVYEKGLICGVRIKTPTGNMTFETELGAMNDYVYIYTYDSNSIRPSTQRFSNGEEWLNLFLMQAAKLIDPLY